MDDEAVDFRALMRNEALSASTPISEGSDAIADKKAASAGDLSSSPVVLFRKGSKKEAEGAASPGRRVSMSTYRAESTESDEADSSAGPVSFERLIGDERDRERKQIDSLRTTLPQLRRLVKSMGESRMAAFKELAFASSILEDSFNTSAESPYLLAVSELLSIPNVALPSLLVPLRLRYVHLALSKNVQLVSQNSLDKDVSGPLRTITGKVTSIVVNHGLYLSEAVAMFILAATNAVLGAAGTAVGSAASKVVSDLMAVLRVLNTAAPSLVDIFRVSISKLIFRMTKFPVEGVVEEALVSDDGDDLLLKQSALIDRTFASLNAVRSQASLIASALVQVTSTVGVSLTSLTHMIPLFGTFLSTLNTALNDTATSCAVNEKVAKLRKVNTTGKKAHTGNKSIAGNVWTADLLDHSDASASPAQIFRKMTEQAGEFFKVVVLTHDSFLSAWEFLDALIARLIPPASIDPAAAKLVKLRSSVVLKYWLKAKFRGFDVDFIAHVLDVCEKQLPNNGLSDLAENIVSTISSLLQSVLVSRPSLPDLLVTLRDSTSSPATIVAAADPGLIARQFAHLAHEHYRQIDVSELLKLAWSKARLAWKSPHVLALLRQSDNIAFWAASVILSEPGVKERAELLSKLITVARHSFHLHDFNTLMGILVGLSNSAVSRLRKTWALLDPEDIQDYKVLEELMSPQSAFAAYREYIASVSPPCVPMLAVYLSDLTLVDENVDLVFGLVNLDKLRLVYEIISRVQLYQHEAYSTIMRVEPLAAYLECLPRWSEDELYDISLALEPRDAAPPQQAGPSPSKNRDSVSKSDKDRGPRPGPIIATLTQNRTKRSGSKRTLVISGSGSSSSLDRTSKGPETPRTSIGRKPSFLSNDESRSSEDSSSAAASAAVSSQSQLLSKDSLTSSSGSLLHPVDEMDSSITPRGGKIPDTKRYGWITMTAFEKYLFRDGELFDAFRDYLIEHSPEGERVLNFFKDLYKFLQIEFGNKDEAKAAAQAIYSTYLDRHGVKTLKHVSKEARAKVKSTIEKDRIDALLFVSVASDVRPDLVGDFSEWQIEMMTEPATQRMRERAKSQSLLLDDNAFTYVLFDDEESFNAFRSFITDENQRKVLDLYKAIQGVVAQNFFSEPEVVRSTALKVWQNFLEPGKNEKDIVFFVTTATERNEIKAAIDQRTRIVMPTLFDKITAAIEPGLQQAFANFQREVANVERKATSSQKESKKTKSKKKDKVETPRGERKKK